MVFEDLQKRISSILDSAGGYSDGSDTSYSPEDIIDKIKNEINDELDQLTDDIFIPLDNMDDYQIQYESDTFKNEVRNSIDYFVDRIKLSEYK